MTLVNGHEKYTVVLTICEAGKLDKDEIFSVISIRDEIVAETLQKCARDIGYKCGFQVLLDHVERKRLTRILDYRNELG